MGKSALNDKWYVHCCLVAKLCPTLLQPHGLQPSRLLHPWDSPGENTGVGCHCLLQWCVHGHSYKRITVFHFKRDSLRETDPITNLLFLL